MKKELEIGDSVYAYFENKRPLEFKIEKETSNVMYAIAKSVDGYIMGLSFRKKLKDDKIIPKPAFTDIEKLIIKTDETEKIFNNDVKRFDLIEELNNFNFKHLNEKELDNILKIVKNERSNSRFRSVQRRC